MAGILDKLNFLGPSRQANPLRSNVFSDAADDMVSGGTRSIPSPVIPVVGPEHAAQLMAQHGDSGNAMSLLGVKPGFAGIRRAPVQQSAPLRFAPSPVPQGISLPTSPNRRSVA